MQKVDDRRTLRSRKALTDAFMTLVVEAPYEQIKLADIVERAGVGRSTFYKHFANKEELLRQSLTGGFETWADLAKSPDVERLKAWLTALWDNRRFARILLAGRTRAHLVRSLAALIEDRLSGPNPKLIALALAEAEFGLLHAWLSGAAPATVETMAGLMMRTAEVLATDPAPLPPA